MNDSIAKQDLENCRVQLQLSWTAVRADTCIGSIVHQHDRRVRAQTQKKGKEMCGMNNCSVSISLQESDTESADKLYSRDLSQREEHNMTHLQ